MTIFYVNNNIIDYNTLWYHYQTNPHPGGNLYKVVLSLDELEIIKIIEKMIGVSVKDESFVEKSLKHNESTFNIINYICIGMREKNKGQKNSEKIQWVFNNIDKIKVTEQELLIEGIASIFVQNW